MTLRLACGFLAAFAFACAHWPAFKPAPGDTLVAGQPLAAQSAVAGVRVLVHQKPWEGDPGNLTEVVTPLDVTIINDSAGPIPLRYRDFTLDTESGVQLKAVPPFRISRSAGQTRVRPLYPSDRFLFYGPYSSYYPGYPVWEGPFDSDLSWYDSAYNGSRRCPRRTCCRRRFQRACSSRAGT